MRLSDCYLSQSEKASTGSCSGWSKGIIPCARGMAALANKLEAVFIYRPSPRAGFVMAPRLQQHLSLLPEVLRAHGKLDELRIGQHHVLSKS